MYVIIVYFYLFICLLILLYTILYVFMQNYIKNRQKRYKNLFIESINNARKQNDHEEKEYSTRLYNDLKQIKKLTAFENALDNFVENNIDITDYLKNIELTIMKLVIYYQRKSKMEQAYLAWFIATHSRQCWNNHLIYETLITYLDNSNVYLRENVLIAIYRQPNVQYIIEVFKLLTDEEIYHSPKLIQDGLLSHPFNREQLAAELWANIEEFQPSIVQGAIDFISNQSNLYKESFLELLVEPSTDLEIKTRLMRYFRRHRYQESVSILIEYLQHPEEVLRTVAAHVLSVYPSEQTVDALKLALTDSNWYVRRNASLSLVSMNISKEEIENILQGQDTFAKEMITYHLEEEGVVL